MTTMLAYVSSVFTQTRPQRQLAVGFLASVGALTSAAPLLAQTTQAEAVAPGSAPPAAEQLAPVAPVTLSTPATVAPAAEAPPRKMVLNTAPASTSTVRTYHLHDGFYLRGGINYGAGWGGLTVGEDDQTAIDYSGGLLGLDLLIGGTPSPGFSVGGGISLGSFLQPDMEVGGDSAATSNFGLLLIGPFVDGHFAPNGGWHAGALAGFAGLGKTPHTDGAGGFGGAVWLGYDTWVGDDWALGGNLRFTAATASGSKPTDFSASALAISLGFSVLYH